MTESSDNRSYQYPGVEIRILDRPITYVLGRNVDSSEIYYQQQLGVHYSRIEAVLSGGKLISEAGIFNASKGNVHFEPLNLGASSMMSGVVSSRRGDKFFKNTLTGTGFVWLAETLSYLMVIHLKNQVLTLERGIFYAGIGDLHFSISNDINASNMVLNAGKGMVNTIIRGSGYVVLELPVRIEDLIRVPITRNAPARVDDELVLFRMGQVNRTSELTSGIVGSMLNQEGVLNTYSGQGYICIAPTARAQAVLNYQQHNKTDPT